ncbi:MAG: hypothetical protein U0232_21435 [Thermomicrobiales bacterium]
MPCRSTGSRAALGHFTALGYVAVGVPILNRDDADNPEHRPCSPVI